MGKLRCLAQWRFAVIIIGMLLLAGCGQDQSALNPDGPAANRIALSWWIMLGISSLVFAVVLALVIWSFLRSHDRKTLAAPFLDEAPWAERRFVITLGIAIPAVILIGFSAFIIYTESALAEPDDDPTERVEVIGHQWWWEVRYPERGIVTANEIHIPVGEAVEVELTTTDVIHSFWVPSLQGKVDMIPGHVNRIWLEADSTGRYRGQCAEFCGLQHAKMAFTVVADEPDAYARWVESQQQVPAIPSSDEILQGQQVFLGSACVYCHRIAGTNASSDVGPDLTHFASRDMLGAGTLNNTKGNLAAWIINSQHFKPGNQMPPMDLSGPELQALLTYLETLD